MLAIFPYISGPIHLLSLNVHLHLKLLSISGHIPLYLSSGRFKDLLPSFSSLSLFSNSQQHYTRSPPPVSLLKENLYTFISITINHHEQKKIPSKPPLIATGKTYFDNLLDFLKFFMPLLEQRYAKFVIKFKYVTDFIFV